MIYAPSLLNGSRCFRFTLLGIVASCPPPLQEQIKIITIDAPLVSDPDATQFPTLYQCANRF